MAFRPAISIAALLAVSALPVRADYPIVSHRYLADPSAMVHDGRVYVYCSNDDDNAVDGNYIMKSIVCVSTSDLKNWTDHGEVLRVPANAAWAAHAWAPAVIARNGQFYLYFGNNASGIGVASSTSPVGPFTDARGSALITSSTPGVLPATNIWIFDPAVFIDDDGQAYLYFGGNGESNVRIIRLNEDMISTSGPAIALTVPNFFEAAWMHKRGGVYYFSYSTVPSAGMRIDYLTSSSPIGGFTYGGVAAGQPPNNNNNNHASIFEFNGRWYHVYHNRIVAQQAGIPTVYRRNIAIEQLEYEPGGAIRQVTYTPDGVVQVRALDPYARVEAETFHSQSGVETGPCSEGGMSLTNLAAGDWVRVRGVDFGSLGAATFTARISAATGGGAIELRLGSPTGTLLGTCTIEGTGGNESWTTVSCPVSGATGMQDLHLVFAGADLGTTRVNWWQFTETPTAPVVTVQPRNLTLKTGARMDLWVEVSGSGPMAYQWYRDGTPLAGATARFLDVASIGPSDAGNYHVEVSNAAGTAASDAASVSLDGQVSSRVVNMSVRAPLAAGGTLIPGFVRAGTAPQQLLIRAIGPGLGFAELMESGYVPDPSLAIFAGPSRIETNDNWGDAPNRPELEAAALALGAFDLAPDGLDAAALISLPPALYTAHVTANGGSGGIVLFELYEDSSATSHFVNISARGDVGTGDEILIPGFSLAGTGATTLLIRAVGPSLRQHDVEGWVADPKLTLFAGSTPILSCDDWGDATAAATLDDVGNEVGAFPLDPASTDAAVLATLMPGVYTVHAVGVNGATGNVLVEVYVVP